MTKDIFKEMVISQISELSSTDFLTLVQDECAKRKVSRNKIKGGNDIEINKIHMLLTDQFWMRKIYVILVNGEYKGFKYDKNEAQIIADQYLLYNQGSTHYGARFEAYIKEEIVDLRDIY